MLPFLGAANLFSYGKGEILFEVLSEEMRLLTAAKCNLLFASTVSLDQWNATTIRYNTDAQVSKFVSSVPVLPILEVLTNTEMCSDRLCDDEITLLSLLKLCNKESPQWSRVSFE